LTSFLDAGKGLYIEGCDFAAQNDTTQLLQRFGCILGGGGLPKDSGNVNILIGQSSSPVNELEFGYPFRQDPDHFADYLVPQLGIPMFKSQESLTRGVCWSGSSNKYRAICSAIIFGGLKETTNNKNELMLRYLNYLYKRS